MLLIMIIIIRYCGHGSGSQYIASERIQRLKVKPLQMLFGCSSVALKDLGGHTDMYGDVMEFAIACRLLIMYFLKRIAMYKFVRCQLLRVIELTSMKSFNICMNCSLLVRTYPVLLS